jgi:hypothetical protein
MSDKKDKSAEVNRRRLLRGAGAAVAGAVGAGVAATVASPANAAAGGNVVLGANNDAGTTTTTVTTSNADTAALALSNPSGPSLTLAATTSIPSGANTSPDGSIIADQYGNLFTNQLFSDNNSYYTRVFTDGWATQVFPITPARALDTRDPKLSGGLIQAQRDSTGRLKGGTSAFLDISNLIQFGVAVQANVTVVGAAGGGFLTIWPGTGAKPNSSTINFQVNAALSNYFQCGLASYSDAQHDVFEIYASTAVHIIVDVVGFITFSAGQITAPAIHPALKAAPLDKSRFAALAANHPKVVR